MNLPRQVVVNEANDSELDEIREYLLEFSHVFDFGIDRILKQNFL